MKAFTVIKKVLYPAILITFCGIMCVFVGCDKNDETPSPSDLIIGTWTISSTTMDLSFGGKSLIQYLIEELGLSQAEAAVFDDLLQSSLLEFFEGTIEFKRDKTYVINIGGETDTGTYSISADGKTLLMDAGTKDETEATILTLDATKLIFEMTQHAEEDLNGDGLEEVFNMNITMTLTK